MGGRKKTSSVGRGERKPVLSEKVLRGILALADPRVAQLIDVGGSRGEAGVSEAKRAIEFAGEMLRFRSANSRRGRG